MKAANTSKKKGTMYWEANTAFCCNWGGKQRNWVGNCPPSLYVKRGPDTIDILCMYGPSLAGINRRQFTFQNSSVFFNILF